MLKLMENNMMNDQSAHYFIVGLAILFYSCFYIPASAQCDINTCIRSASLTASPPVFNAANRSIQINDITFANAGCNDGDFILGIDIYVFQLLPNNSQIRNCNVLAPVPNNLLGVVHLDLGKATICGQSFEIEQVIIGTNTGFEICDGARYQIEMALYATTDVNFRSLDKTVDSELNSSEYLLTNLGIIEANITNTFNNGQPVIATEISNWATRSNTTVIVPCNQDVEIYAQGQSIIADCTPFGDYSNAIPSEMVNSFSYAVNGGTPVIIENSLTGSSGGQLSGAISSINSACYGGIITDMIPYTFDASNLANACGGTEVTFSISTTDVFTNQTKTAEYTVIFDSCVPTLTLNNSALNNAVYAAEQTINSAGTITNNGAVVFQAGDQVSLNNNFTVPSNTNFAVEIATCQ